MLVNKRDGSVEVYSPEKLRNALVRAIHAGGVKDNHNDLAEQMAREIETEILRLNQNGVSAPKLAEIVERIVYKHDQPTYKAFILFRDQRHRNKSVYLDARKLIDEYVGDETWLVRENSNMGFSIQGLNAHISSSVASQYWLNKIYPEKIKDAHKNAFFHIHDLGCLMCYCCGWDLLQLLTEGFLPVQNKIVSAPAKHLRTALGQLVNFLFTLQLETAGANAVSNFDTLLAPFVFFDDLTDEKIEQSLQEFFFNMNVATRIGFQCLSEDTEILTKDGWKGYTEVLVGSLIATFNLKTQEVEYLSADDVFIKEYKGKMYRLQNRINDQLISPGHRVVRKLFNAPNPTFVLEDIEQVKKLKSSFIVPLKTQGYLGGKSNLTLDEVMLIAWVIAEGTSCQGSTNSGRISIYQSEKSPYYQEILDILKRLGLEFTVRTQIGLGECNCIRFNAEFSRKIYSLFDSSPQKGIKFIPEAIFNLSPDLSRIFLDTYMKGDNGGVLKIATTSSLIKDGLMQVCVNAGYGVTVRERHPVGIGKLKQYIIRILKSSESYIQKITEVDYQGIIWCPTTSNGTVIARRNGKVFITGNSPFSNVTLDIDCPEYLKSQMVIVGGKPVDQFITEEWLDKHYSWISKRFMEETGIDIPKKATELGKATIYKWLCENKATYGAFQKEMNRINVAFCKVMLQGDARGRIFSYPIPTYNVTKDFKFEGPVAEGIFKMTAKYGVPYFANYINSELDPEDIRSMCPLSGDTVVPVRLDGVTGNYRMKDLYVQKGSKEVLFKDEWYSAEMLEIESEGCIEIKTGNGECVVMDLRHVQPRKVSEDSSLEEVEARQLRIGDYLPYSLDSHINFSARGFYADGFWWYQILSIDTVKTKEPVYCFMVDSNEHLFQLANGLVTHNCRLSLSNKDISAKGVSGLFTAHPMTGSIGVVTLNLPRLAYLARKANSSDEDARFNFKQRIADMMDLASDSLRIKRDTLETFTDVGLYPYSREYLRHIKQRTGKYWKNHFGTIGLVGMNEACLNLIGKDIATPEGKSLAMETLDFMLNRLDEFKAQDDTLWNLEATPAEGATTRFARRDQEEFKDIFQAGTPENPYYSNSVHLPVKYSSDIFEILEHQEELQRKFTGGTVVHLFLGEALNSWESAAALVKQTVKFNIPYFTLTPVFSICDTHGYMSGQHEECPKCAEERIKELMTLYQNRKLDEFSLKAKEYGVCEDTLKTIISSLEEQ